MSQSTPEAVIERPEAGTGLVQDRLLDELDAELLAEAHDRDRREDDGGAQMFTDV